MGKQCISKLLALRAGCRGYFSRIMGARKTRGIHSKTEKHARLLCLSVSTAARQHLASQSPGFWVAHQPQLRSLQPVLWFWHIVWVFWWESLGAERSRAEIYTHLIRCTRQEKAHWHVLHTIMTPCSAHTQHTLAALLCYVLLSDEVVERKL